MVTPEPTRVRVRSYQVGFGDCFLVTVSYDRPDADGRSERHLLIDFGCKIAADDGPTMAQVAEKIAEHCGGRLDIVAVTHRHQDHVRGFGERKPQEHLDPLDPQLVIRPWTDMPTERRVTDGAGLDQDSLGFLGLLDAMEDHVQTVESQFDLDRRVLAKRAKELAALGVKNVQAIAMLENWVAPERSRWVRAGDAVDASATVPGMHIEVLGPPTLAQVPAMKSYASSSAEYWMGMLGEARIAPELVAPREKDELLPAKRRVAAPDGLGRAAWLLDRLHDEAPGQVLEIVEGFDDVLNNTSLVLLLTIGDRRLLFAGDAQVENWSYPLDAAFGGEGREPDADLRDRLSDVDVYKVGHHGSRNATPRRLVELWTAHRTNKAALSSIVSTKSDTYGSTAEGKVPKPELLDALRELGPLYSTEDLPEDVWWFDVEAPVKGKKGFVYAAGPPQG